MEGREEIYQIGLSRTPGIGLAHAKKLIKRFGSASEVFRATKDELLSAGLREEPAQAILEFCGHAAVEAEVRVLASKKIRPLFFTDPDYPRRLLSIPEAPPILFYRGKADLNTKKILAVVGTRAADDYGKQMTANLIRQLAQPIRQLAEPIGQLADPGLLVVSGLAFGIDAAAHSAAMVNRLPTVAVLGHGLGTIYPTEHRAMADAMVEEGGLLTALDYHVRAERFHFPDRNRWVAGMCDALLVVETGKEGGSMLTVNCAVKYGKKIFAVPGRATDHRSAGCNSLIRQGTAQMVSSGQELTAAMGWEWPAGGAGTQAKLEFGRPGGGAQTMMESGSSADGSLSAEDRLLGLLRKKESSAIDELIACSHLDASAVALSLLNLELRGSVRGLPGKRYMLAGGG